MLVASAATVVKLHAAPRLETIGDISAMLTSSLGTHVGRLIFSVGVLGASMVAATVTSILSGVTGYGSGALMPLLLAVPNVSVAGDDGVLRRFAGWTEFASAIHEWRAAAAAGTVAAGALSLPRPPNVGPAVGSQPLGPATA